jgi:MFS family permease
MVKVPWTRRLAAIPGEVILLGLVSLLTDVSSEMIFGVLPIFLTAVLGASALLLGLTEGLADFAASSLDLASGYASDRTGRRKGLALLGYGLSSSAKAALVLASAVPHVVAFRVVERLGKSIHGPPRDALLSSIAAGESRGLSFGVHKALDKAGAILGPLFAYFLLERLGTSAWSFHVLFVVAAVPAFLAVGLLGLAVRERPAPPRLSTGIFQAVRALGPRFRHYIVTAGIFSLGYFSFAFLILKANLVGFGADTIALLYALLNAVFVLVSIPLGALGDRIGRRAIVALSYTLYAITAAGLLVATSKAAVLAMFGLYGVFFAIDEAQTRAYLADLSAPEWRATALGVYGFVSGLGYLPASLIAGRLWQTYGPQATFGFAVTTSFFALVYFLWMMPGEE